jgi:predicted 3-demethylubiquinone-9 3-methyltransferase (glyoxalase superfamily)
MNEQQLIEELDELDQTVLEVQEKIAWIRDKFGLWKIN